MDNEIVFYTAFRAVVISEIFRLTFCRRSEVLNLIMGRKKSESTGLTRCTTQYQVSTTMVFGCRCGRASPKATSYATTVLTCSWKSIGRETPWPNVAQHLRACMLGCVASTAHGTDDVVGNPFIYYSRLA
jgi:hypothetical protein